MVKMLDLFLVTYRFCCYVIYHQAVRINYILNENDELNIFLKLPESLYQCFIFGKTSS